MAAKLSTRGNYSRSGLSHSTRAKSVATRDSATVTIGSHTLHTFGTKVSRETVKDFFLEEIATILLHLLIPAIVILAGFIGWHDIPFMEHSHSAETTIRYCIPNDTTTTMVVLIHAPEGK